MSSMLSLYRIAEFFYTSVFILRWMVLPYLLVPSFSTFLGIAPMFMTGGFYLAFFFVISHNFVGVHMFDSSPAAAAAAAAATASVPSSSPMKDSFLYNQVISSCNVGGSLLAMFNGGLNYQIEHHLFPRISHTHYAKIAPIVREFCKKKGIPYVHFRTIQENVTSCVQHLSNFGHEKNPYSEFKFW
jgi:acyl-lipid (7-3)-desaturase (Delta-4 desaturase)